MSWSDSQTPRLDREGITRFFGASTAEDEGESILTTRIHGDDSAAVRECWCDEERRRVVRGVESDSNDDERGVWTERAVVG